MKSTPVLQTAFPLPVFGKGKVRDTYDLGDRLLMVATDRISAFDSVLPTGIPYKGEVLTALSAFWFEMTGDLVPNHMISTEPEDFPFDWSGWSERQQEELRGHSMLVRKAQRIDIECVARGYLAGSGWAEYKKAGTVTGISLPPGLEESSELPQPIFTPATKAETGHDENISFEKMAAIVGWDLAVKLRDATLKIYSYVAEYARTRGIIVADTKLEFGLLDGKLIVIDEMITPDSSRFWEIDKYRTGESQVSLDKQYVRDWLLGSGWDREPPAPPLPDEVAEKTAEKYLEAYSRLTRRDLLSELDPHHSQRGAHAEVAG